MRNTWYRRSDTRQRAGALPQPCYSKYRRDLPKMEITVYSALWCPDCREAKRFLDRHQLSYTDINIETTPGAADEVVKRTGKRAIPQFVIDGEWVQPYRLGEGFLYEEMAKRLGIEQ